MKILFTDLDGTLLDDAKNISPGNRAALERALSAGHRVVITTGRPLLSSLEQSRRLGLDGDGCYLIAYNGGVVYDFGKKERIYKRTLSIPLVLEIIRLCRELGIHVQSYDDETVLVEPDCDNETVRFYCRRIRMNYRVVPSFDTDMRVEPPKVLAIAPREQLEQLYRALGRFDAELDYFYSTQTLLEIVPKGVSKGAAVAWMCQRMHIPLEDSIAAGDEENDLSMIRTAGVGAAMANAIPMVKEAADYITQHDNNHDGIAEIVEKFMLSKR